MKSWLSLVTVTLVASASIAQEPAASVGASAAKAPAFKAHVLSNAEFDALRAKPEQLLIVDVRRPDELTANGGFPLYLSVQESQLEHSIAWIPKDRTIVTVSNHANRAGRAADLLASKGFKVAGAVGAQTYEAQGGKLTKIVAPPRKPASGT